MWSSYVQIHYCINLLNMLDSKLFLTFKIETDPLLSIKGSSQSLVSSRDALILLFVRPSAHIWVFAEAKYPHECLLIIFQT